MKSPNRRYGNPDEFAYYVVGVPIKTIARELMRDGRTVRDWLSRRRKIPYWVPELLRLRDDARAAMVYAMTAAAYQRPRIPTAQQVSTPATPPFWLAANERVWTDEEAA